MIQVHSANRDLILLFQVFCKIIHKLTKIITIGIVTSEDLIRLIADNDSLNAEAERMDLAALASEGWISSTTLM